MFYILRCFLYTNIYNNTNVKYYHIQSLKKYLVSFVIRTCSFFFFLMQRYVCIQTHRRTHIYNYILMLHFHESKKKACKINLTFKVQNLE